MQGITACQKEKLPKPISASFQIKEVIADPDFWSKETYNTDTVSTAEVEFLADQSQDSNIVYQWKIGSDSRIFTQKDFNLKFLPSTVNNIEVNLTVTRKDLNGNIIDSKSALRTFYFGKPRVEGHFQGYFEGFSQRADVYINYEYANPVFANEKGIMITSNIGKFDSLFSPEGWNEHVILNRRIYFDWANTIGEGINNRIRFPHGSINLDKDYKSLTIDLTVKEVSTGRDIPMKFKGTKIL
jgi:hypothetical protein